MNKVIILMSALLMGACAGPEAPLAKAKLGGDFALIDQSGRPTKASDFAGKYRILYTGYTNCPDICPTDALVIGQALKKFEQQDRMRGNQVVPIFLSADPQRDTPDQLKKFLANFHPRFVGLTGSLPDVDAALRKFGSYGARDTKTGIVDHGRAVILYGPDGKPIDSLPVEQGVGPVVAALEEWVR
jgi:protein SCO1